MKLPIIVFLVIGLAVADEEIKKEENVWVLTNSNFDSVISDNKFVLAEFCKLTPFPAFQILIK